MTGIRRLAETEGGQYSSEAARYETFQPEPWPIILSKYQTEVIEDGWQEKFVDGDLAGLAIEVKVYRSGVELVSTMVSEIDVDSPDDWYIDQLAYELMREAIGEARDIRDEKPVACLRPLVDVGDEYNEAEVVTG